RGTHQVSSLRLAAFEGLGHTLDGRVVYLDSRIDSPYKQIDFWMRTFPMQTGIQEEFLVKSILVEDGGKIRSKFTFKAVSQTESWLSTGQELYHIKEGEKQKFGRADGLPSDFINDINLDAEGIVWLATEKGVAFYEERKGWQTFEPLAKISCRKLIFDQQNHLWIGTQQGLFRWDGLVLERFDNRMGLVSNDINSLVLDPQNRLWIGTSRGVSRLDLQQMIRGAETPVLITREVELDGIPIAMDSIPEIQSSQSLSWEYAGLYFTNPQEVVYRYRFFPQDDWQYTEQDRISASLLQPGNYRLQIEVRNARSEWGSQLNFPFVVLRPWWQSVWAIMLGVLLLGFLFAAIFYFRLQIIKTREARKREVSKRIAELELKALEAQMNPHFIFNALNAIQYFVLENDVESSHRYLTRFAKLMRMFLESSRKSEHSLSDEIEMLRYYIEMEQLCYEDVFEYEIHLEDSLFAEDILLPAMLLQPFVENAIRHGLLHKQNGEGRLLINIAKKGEQLEVLIKDNGIGRKKMAMLKQKVEREYVSRAMQIVNERIQLQAFVENTSIQIEITDKEPEKEIDPGTIVSVSMPYREAIFV
ncbi:MAG: histidine kinase, partial [Bacteroidota bacterium]